MITANRAFTAHACFNNPMQATDIDVLTYPLPSRTRRKYRAVLVGATSEGRRWYLSHADHQDGEMAAMKALLENLQIASDVLVPGNGQMNSDTTMSSRDSYLTPKTSLTRHLMKCLRFLPCVDMVLGCMRGICEDQEHEHKYRYSEPSNGSLAENGSVEYGMVPPNTPSDDHAHRDSGRLAGNAEFEHFIRRTDGLGEYKSEVRPTTLPLIHRVMSTATTPYKPPVASTLMRHFPSSCCSQNTTLSHQIHSRNMPASYHDADALPPAYSPPFDSAELILSILALREDMRRQGSGHVGRAKLDG